MISRVKKREQELQKVRLTHFNIHESVVRVKDAEIGRLVDVDYRNGKMWCGLCETSECIHTGFAWAIQSRYTPKR